MAAAILTTKLALSFAILGATTRQRCFLLVGVHFLTVRQQLGPRYQGVLCHLVRWFRVVTQQACANRDTQYLSSYIADTCWMILHDPTGFSQPCLGRATNVRSSVRQSLSRSYIGFTFEASECDKCAFSSAFRVVLCDTGLMPNQVLNRFVFTSCLATETSFSAGPPSFNGPAARNGMQGP